MNKIFLVFIILLSLSFAKYIELGEVSIVYDINRYGDVRVTEDITYLLRNCENDPFREIYIEKPPGLIIKNPSGYCSNTKCNFRYDTFDKSISGSNELVLELNEIKCGEVKARFDYDVYPIVLAKDTAQFYYKIWGEKSPEASVNIKIVFPEDISSEIIKTEIEEVEIQIDGTNETGIIKKEIKKNEIINNILYFIHKEDFKYEISESGNILEINSYQKPREMLEINLLMPKEWFVENNNFIYRRDISKEQIIEIEEKDQIIRSYKWLLDLILMFIFIFYLLVPFIILGVIYYIYGKEYSPKEVEYSAIYERELPSEHTPAEAIFFVKGDEEYSQKERGNAIVATMMSFVNKGIADIEEKNKEVYMTFDFEKRKKIKLENYESSFLDFIEEEFGNKTFNIKDFEKKSSKKVKYYQLVNKFFMHISKINKRSEFVENHGNIIGNVALSIYMLLSFFIMFFEPLILVGILFGGVSMMIIKNKKIMLAKWTKKGRVLNLKWESFRKYLTDYSLMKEHPPESVKLWDEYLTYAIALGVADKTMKIMEKIAPKIIQKNTHSVTHVYLTTAVALRMNRSFTPSYVSKTSPSMGGYSGRAGGFGGGMGGGGIGGR